MKQFKSLYALVAVLSISVAVSAQSADYYGYFVANGISYMINSETENTVSITVSEDGFYHGAITIPDTVWYDGIPYIVTVLSSSAFYGCSNLTSLTLPATIHTFEPYCFYNCGLTSLQLPDSLRVIGDHAFGYSHIVSLHLPARFESYGDAAFWTRNLSSITVDEDNPNYCSINGWLFSKDSVTLCIVPDRVPGSIEVPTYVRHIGKMAFGNNNYITSVTLHEGLLSIGDFAFNICPTIDNVVIPSSVTHIGVCPFSYCPLLDHLSIDTGNTHYVMDGKMIYSSNYDTLVSCHKSGSTVTLNPNLKVLGGFENNTWLQNIEIPEGVTDISESCFSGCNFTSIVLPQHMKSIGKNAFSTNSQLRSVTMPLTLLEMGEDAFDGCDRLNAIVIPDSLRVIPDAAFLYCSLASITWGNAVEEIGMGAFEGQVASSIVLPPTLRKIGDYAFSALAPGESDNLRRVTVTSQLDTIGKEVFLYSLKSLRFTTGDMPPVVMGPVFRENVIDSIIVPCGSLQAWLDDSYWGTFADKYYEDCIGIDNVANNDEKVYSIGDRIIVECADGETVQIFDMLGRQMISCEIQNSIFEIQDSKLSTGIYIVRVGNRPARKVTVTR